MTDLITELTNDIDYSSRFDGEHGLVEAKWKFRFMTKVSGKMFSARAPKVRKTEDLYQKLAKHIETRKMPAYICGGDSQAVFNEEVFISSWSHGEANEAYIYGTEAQVKSVEAFFRSLHRDQPRISFLFTGSHGSTEERDIYLDEIDTAHDIHYPYIKEGVNTFLDAFWADKAPILFLQGPPGTGKTSLIRYLLKHRNATAKVTFDENVMKSDAFYLEFLMKNNHQILIVEDADAIIKSRESFGNKIVSKLLNFAEGIVKLKAKKIIFSTNLDNFDEIDPALVRPGRCYEVVECRKLTADEANNVRQFHGIEPVYDGQKYYTLAEIFNGKSNPTQRRRIGF